MLFGVLVYVSGIIRVYAKKELKEPPFFDGCAFY